ncbi:subclass B3 metallo-beta-lactamase [Brevundimonas poindexterae]|uniref:subclass B3 metallo-beta-lactamase n=1 Tax=Brevundimonas poindexterae TaxID=74325 RepID=UPI001CFE7BD3|nr:subclass B3 metallo-beta-lactamase [Brevundimonas poindexterae]
MLRSILLAVALMLGAAPALAQDEEDARVEWNRPAPPFTVVGNVHFVGVAGLGAWLITTPEGHILIDGGLPESAPRIIQSIRELGFEPTDVRILLNTHAHVDHAGGLAELQAVTGARIIASEGDRGALESGRHHGLTNYGTWWFPPVHVDQVIADGETIELGGVRLTAIITPGHTAGCTNWSLPVRDHDRDLNVLFFCSASIGGNRLVGNTEYPGIVDDYRRTFQRLGGIKTDVVLANHPEVADLFERRERQIKGDANAFVDSAALGEIVEAYREAFEAELQRQRAGDRR